MSLKYLEEKNITLELTDGVKEFLASEGYDPAFGARPLKRAIQRQILDAMATEILQGHIAEGDRVVADIDSKERTGFASRRKRSERRRELWV